jgi:hypothetical protein
VARFAPLLFDPVQMLRSYALGDHSDQPPLTIGHLEQLVCL